MCDPVTMGVMIAASAGMSYMGQKQAADANYKMAVENQNLQIKGLQNQANEASAKTEQELLSNQKEALANQATARVAAGESGVSGLSVDALLGDIERQGGENKLNILENYSFGVEQRDLNRQGVGINTRSQINQVSEPNLLGTALQAGVQMAGAGVFDGGFTTGSQLNSAGQKVGTFQKPPSALT